MQEWLCKLHDAKLAAQKLIIMSQLLELAMQQSYPRRKVCKSQPQFMLCCAKVAAYILQDRHALIMMVVSGTGRGCCCPQAGSPCLGECCPLQMHLPAPLATFDGHADWSLPTAQWLARPWRPWSSYTQNQTVASRIGKSVALLGVVTEACMSRSSPWCDYGSSGLHHLSGMLWRQPLTLAAVKRKLQNWPHTADKVHMTGNFHMLSAAALSVIMHFCISDNAAEHSTHPLPGTFWV